MSEKLPIFPTVQRVSFLRFWNCFLDLQFPCCWPIWNWVEVQQNSLYYKKLYFVLPLHWFSPSFCTENTVRFFSILNDFHSVKILIFSPLWESFFYELGLSSRITNANWIHLVIYWATFTLCKLGCP